MSTKNTRNRIIIALSGLALVTASGSLVTGAAAAQDGESEDFPTMEELLEGNGRHGPQEDPEARMRRLFGEVETKLQEVDVLLVDAAAGDTSKLKLVGEAGISNLLRDSLDRGRAAQKDIAEILEIAKQLSSQAQGGGGT